MKSKSGISAAIAASSLAFALCGCSDEQSTPQTAKSPSAPASSPAIKPISLEPRYEATPASGIQFGKPGYPTFLKEVQGMAGVEPWGRWTDATTAPTAKFVFVNALPKRFTLEIEGYGLGPNAYEPVKVRAGSVERSFTFGNPAKASYRIAFDGVDSDTIEIVPPAPILPREVTPANTSDTRKLGIALKSLKVLD
jgi:phosphoglycerol transferase